MHHYKELVVRGAFGYGFGYLVSRKVYGHVAPEMEPEIKNNPKLAEQVEDIDSLQYAEMVRKRQMKSEIDFVRPGKIRD